MKNLLLSIACFISLAANGQAIDSAHYTKKQLEEILTYVEEMPTYPGNLSEFLSANVHYPDSARYNNIEGRVVVRFVITANGHVGDVVVTRGIGYGCDEEAVRVVKLMGKWKPGKRDGIPVNVYYNLPFMFKLEDPDPIRGNK